MQESVSTITNIAFFLAGLIVFNRSWYVGLTTIVLGIASAGWHWTLHSAWQSFDLIMMYIMLIGLIDYVAGSEYTITAFFAGIGITGLHFIVPSHLIIAGIAIVLFYALTHHYPPGRILIIVIWFSLWIATNIPYLRAWDVPFWLLDVLHGISHICASIGIYKTVLFR